MLLLHTYICTCMGTYILAAWTCRTGSCNWKDVARLICRIFSSDIDCCMYGRAARRVSRLRGSRLLQGRENTWKQTRVLGSSACRRSALVRPNVPTSSRFTFPPPEFPRITLQTSSQLRSLLSRWALSYRVKSSNGSVWIIHFYSIFQWQVQTDFLGGKFSKFPNLSG